MIAIACVMSVGCAEEVPPPGPVPLDVGPLADLGLGGRRDGGSVTDPDEGVIVVTDMAVDLGHTPDAGPPGIVVDGRLTTGEWEGALEFSNLTTTVGTPFNGNALETLRVVRTADTLYFALEGALSGTGRALVVYIDGTVGGSAGLVNTFGLADALGELDTLLSTGFLLPADLRVDVAWGTLDFERAEMSPTDSRMGFRSLNDVTALQPIRAGAATVCGVTVCEAAIPLTALGATDDTAVGLFARIVGAGGTVSNETLPFDVPNSPETVAVFASVAAP